MVQQVGDGVYDHISHLGYHIKEMVTQVKGFCIEWARGEHWLTLPCGENLMANLMQCLSRT